MPIGLSCGKILRILAKMSADNYTSKKRLFRERFPLVEENETCFSTPYT